MHIKVRLQIAQRAHGVCALQSSSLCYALRKQQLGKVEANRTLGENHYVCMYEVEYVVHVSMVITQLHVCD